MNKILEKSITQDVLKKYSLMYSLFMSGSSVNDLANEFGISIKQVRLILKAQRRNDYLMFIRRLRGG